MSKPEIDRAILRYRWYLLAGVAVFGANLLVHKHAGFVMGMLTGIQLIMYGAEGGALHNWKSERGLWMLSLLFLLPACAFYAFFGWMEAATVFPFPEDMQEALWTLDLSIGTVVLWKSIRFLASVGYRNWRLGKAY